ncbi:Uncharacterised protein [uncultured archaeon]|nr:Uncharacterised protein [uncultured archaeon]
MMNNRKSRRKMTVEELFDADHYRSIIILTDTFAGEEGLRQLHYRWALIPNHDNMKHTLFIRAMQNFFNLEQEIYQRIGYQNKLERLYAEKIIIKDCITSNSNLSNFLNRLSNQPYNILQRLEKDEVPRYILTDYGKQQAKQWRLIQLIKNVDETMIDNIEKTIWETIEKKIEAATIIHKKENIQE